MREINFGTLKSHVLHVRIKLCKSFEHKSGYTTYCGSQHSYTS